MKLISLAQKLQQHRSCFHLMHLCWAQDPLQLKLVQALVPQNSLNKFVSFAMKYVHVIQMLVMRVSCRRSVDRRCECNWRNKYSRFAYSKREDKDVIKQKIYVEVLNYFMKKKLELSIVYGSNPYLLNEMLQDWLYIIQHYIHNFTWQKEEEWGWRSIRWFTQSCLQNMVTGK